VGAEVGASLGGADIERLSMGRSVRDRGRPAIGSPVRRHFVADREIECGRPPCNGWGTGGGWADESLQRSAGRETSQRSRDRPNAIEP
jgi:hypothetical protein